MQHFTKQKTFLVQPGFVDVPSSCWKWLSVYFPLTHERHCKELCKQPAPRVPTGLEPAGEGAPAGTAKQVRAASYVRAPGFRRGDSLWPFPSPPPLNMNEVDSGHDFG